MSYSNYTEPIHALIGPIDRTIDLKQFGIDVGQTFDQLLSPMGIVNQFALSIMLQVFYITGFILPGWIQAYLAANVTSGPWLALVQYFDKHLNAQSIFNTLARSILSLTWELIARVVTTFFLFGVVETTTQLTNTSLQSVLGFLSSPILKEIMVWRFIFFLVFTSTGLAMLPSILAALGLSV